MLARLRSKHPGSSLADLALYEACSFLTTLVLLVCYRMRAFGLENVPDRGPMLIVANHQSFLDPPLIGAPITARRHLDFIARVGLFSGRAFGGLLRGLNAIPIRQDESDMVAIKETLRRLEMGRAVVVFAEGSRTPDGSVHQFKRGLAVLVRRARCPVVPAAVEGPFDAWPRHRAVPRPWGRVAVAFGPPIDHAALMASGPDAALERLREEIIIMRSRLREHLDQRGTTLAPRQARD